MPILRGPEPESDDEPERDWHLDRCEPDAVSGMGGWRDTGGVASVAHATLRKAAGISIPRASFVLLVLLAYLVILIPINWGLFRLWGRVEWAWAAAPVIALAGTLAVIRLMQLDIGFVRSQTEIDVIEMQTNHAMAHVTRYVALYSSLSSSYVLEFDDPGVIARPFPPTPSPDRARPLTFRRTEGLRLSGFQVDSNSTSFLHTEELRDMGGTLRLIGDSPERCQVANDTPYHFIRVEVWYRASAGELSVCRLEQLAAKTSRPLVFTREEQGDAASGGPPGSDAPAAEVGIDLSGIARLAVRGLRLRPGDVRLVGWLDQPLPGLAVTPTASQTRGRSLLVSHLRYGSLPPPRPDANLLVDVFEPPPEDRSAEAVSEPVSSDAHTDNQE